MKAEITPGQTSDYRGYDAAMDDDLPQPKVLMADRGYDSDHIREDVEQRGGTPIIPARRNRNAREPVDNFLYALRNLVERCIRKLKIAWHLTTHYDRTAASYMGFIELVLTRLRFRHLS